MEAANRSYVALLECIRFQVERDLAARGLTTTVSPVKVDPKHVGKLKETIRISKELSEDLNKFSRYGASPRIYLDKTAYDI